MTEQEWLTCEDPLKLIDCLLDIYQRKADGRKEYLMSVACCRLIWSLLTDERSRLAVELVEQMADDLTLPALPEEVQSDAQDAYIEACHGFATATDDRPAYAAFRASFKSPHGAAQVALAIGWDESSGNPVGATIIRDIYGNPFRPVTADPAWLTSTVVALAQGIYADRAFDRMPILADALQDAGCDNPDVLEHCRGPGPHTRGCWVVDLLLGR